MPAAPLPPLAEAVEVDLELDPQASRIIAAMPAAPPVSAVRRVNWRQRLYEVSSSLRSSHSRRSTASWITSSSDKAFSSLSNLGGTTSASSAANAFRLGLLFPVRLTGP